MHDDGQAIDGNHLFRLGAAHVPQLGQLGALARFDRPGRCCEITLTILKPSEAGTGAMRGHRGDYRFALRRASADPLLVLDLGRTNADVLKALGLEQPGDEHGGQLGADGVGAVDAQYRGPVRRDRQCGEGAGRAAGCHRQQQRREKPNPEPSSSETWRHRATSLLKAARLRRSGYRKMTDGAPGVVSMAFNAVRSRPDSGRRASPSRGYRSPRRNRSPVHVAHGW